MPAPARTMDEEPTHYFDVYWRPDPSALWQVQDCCLEREEAEKTARRIMHNRGGEAQLEPWEE